MAKLRGVCIILLIVFSMSFVSAISNTCEESSQKILSLSDSTNAHGQLIGNDIFNPSYDICYDEIFAENFTGEGDPTICKSGNRNGVLSLTGPFNAHGGGLAEHNNKVCYGDLVCESRSGECLEGEQEVVSLSANRNAHLGIAGEFPTGICCSIPKTIWTDFSENEISEAGLGWQINLVLETLALDDGEEVGFEIFEEDGVLDDSIRKGPEAIVVHALNGKAVANWTITQEDLDKTSDFGEFYFVVGGRKSDNLRIDPASSNHRPVASIVGPVHRGVYFVNNVIQFEHNSFDREGPVNAKWDVGEQIPNDGLDTFTHAYTTPGQKIIKLEVTDSTGKKSVQEISILVLASPGLFVFIDEPADGSAIVSSEMLVDFSGEESFIVNSEDDGNVPCVATITCLGGNCPINTQSAPQCAIDPGQGLVIIAGTRDFNNMNFDWTFSSDALSNPSGLGLSSGQQGYSSIGEKEIVLDIGYNLQVGGVDVPTSQHSVEFTLYDQRQCSADGTTWTEIENDRAVASHNTLNTDKCSGRDTGIGTGDDCCPVGWSCTSGGCEFSGNISELSQCSSYASESACTNDSTRSALNNPLFELRDCGTDQNGANVLCSCTWVDDQCDFKVSLRDAINPGLSGEETCTYETTLGQCDSGYQTLEVKATSNLDNCEDSSQVVPCARPTIQLPFFNFWQFGLGISIVGLIYCLANLNRKK